MTAPVFPVRLDELGARIATREVTLGETFDVGEAKVTVAKGNHPGGVVAYRIEHEGKSVVYATDTEHYACVDPALRALAEGADVLIYDSQYSPEEYRTRRWAGVTRRTSTAPSSRGRRASGKYVLFHHDPMRTDAERRGPRGAARSRSSRRASRRARAWCIDLGGPFRGQGGRPEGVHDPHA